MGALIDRGGGEERKGRRCVERKKGKSKTRPSVSGRVVLLKGKG